MKLCFNKLDAGSWSDDGEQEELTDIKYQFAASEISENL
jgi:hypothetical protein